MRSMSVTPLTLTMHLVLLLVNSFKRLPMPAARMIACMFIHHFLKMYLTVRYPNS